MGPLAAVLGVSWKLGAVLGDLGGGWVVLEASWAVRIVGFLETPWAVFETSKAVWKVFWLVLETAEQL